MNYSTKNSLILLLIIFIINFTPKKFQKSSTPTSNLTKDCYLTESSVIKFLIL